MNKSAIMDLSELDTFALNLAAKITPNTIYYLHGDLGAGKTTFVQRLFAHLGVKADVKSPTFVLLKTYQGRLPLVHVDCYRLAQNGDELGLEEFLPDAAIFIEWPERLGVLFNAISITFTYIDDTHRLVSAPEALWSA